MTVERKSKFMKKTILAAMLTAGLAFAATPNAHAGGGVGWFLAAPLIAGATAVSILAHAVPPPPAPVFAYPQSYAYAAPTYCAPTVRYVAPPVVYAPPCPPPAVVYRAPVYVPAPVVGVSIGFGSHGGYYHGGYYHHHY
jgi:hypothetical protein